MTEYYLRKWNDPILRKECRKVEDFSSLENLVSSMRSIMKKYEGLGLAAPRVGDDRSVLLAQIGSMPKLFINPQIVSAAGYIPFIEGCLSFPGVTVPKLRRYRIDLRYQDEKGMQKEETFRGLNSIVLQHEIDHLHGRLLYQLFKKKVTLNGIKQ